MHQIWVLQILLSLAHWMLRVLLAPLVCLFVFQGRKRASTFSNGAFATTCVTQGPTFGESTKKRKKRLILKGCPKKMGCPISLR